MAQDAVMAQPAADPSGAAPGDAKPEEVLSVEYASASETLPVGSVSGEPEDAGPGPVDVTPQAGGGVVTAVEVKKPEPRKYGLFKEAVPMRQSANDDLYTKGVRLLQQRYKHVEAKKKEDASETMRSTPEIDRKSRRIAQGRSPIWKRSPPRRESSVTPPASPPAVTTPPRARPPPTPSSIADVLQQCVNVEQAVERIGTGSPVRHRYLVHERPTQSSPPMNTPLRADLPSGALLCNIEGLTYNNPGAPGYDPLPARPLHARGPESGQPSRASRSPPRVPAMTPPRHTKPFSPAGAPTGGAALEKQVRQPPPRPSVSPHRARHRSASASPRGARARSRSAGAHSARRGTSPSRTPWRGGGPAAMKMDVFGRCITPPRRTQTPPPQQQQQQQQLTDVKNGGKEATFLNIKAPPRSGGATGLCSSFHLEAMSEKVDAQQATINAQQSTIKELRAIVDHLALAAGLDVKQLLRGGMVTAHRRIFAAGDPDTAVIWNAVVSFLPLPDALTLRSVRCTAPAANRAYCEWFAKAKRRKFKVTCRTFSRLWAAWPAAAKVRILTERVEVRAAGTQRPLPNLTVLPPAAKRDDAVRRVEVKGHGYLILEVVQTEARDRSHSHHSKASAAGDATPSGPAAPEAPPADAKWTHPAISPPSPPQSSPHSGGVETPAPDLL
eukprot:TRINITY_DN7431_c0_g1_i1.p1 TRINITY_DN7431_c0_g1~~TRINITY_DN7431_c0_g1_i1.p1  ORF type:complete len:669 (+),score=157.67 TRINITY_DN7431_c0_g1_i1:36-2042(+)